MRGKTKNLEFIDLYNKLYKENFEELEKLRKEEKKRTGAILKIVAAIFISVALVALLEILGFVGVFAFDSDFSMVFTMGISLIGGITIFIMVISLVITIIKNTKKNGAKKLSYTEMFKQNIMTPIIHNVIPRSEYLFNEGLSREEYKRACWESFDIYNSEDKIITPLLLEDKTESKLIMSEVHTKDRREDSDGDVSEVTLFAGIAGYMELPKSINCYLKVRSNNFLFKTKNNVEMDAREFEKAFDVETDDKIKAMQILTSDIMMDFVEFTKENKFMFEFYISNSTMYIRFHTGNLFEPEVFKVSMEYQYLEKYVNILNSVKEITEHICNVIINTDL
ncbi:MAG: DUF3137 domain-containing protein [Clostridia bacterium]|nr:DUF3137 domain-containing protein [Clostridia bacterium]